MDKKQYRTGVMALLGANTLWGFLPLYWNALKPIESPVIILYRIVLMAVLCYIATAVLMRGRGIFKPMLESRKTFCTYLAAGILISINWSIFIWAVNSGNVIQSSMGYFIEPLVVCLFGIIFYKETTNLWKKIAIGFAICGLLIMVIGYRQVPVIAVGLGITFAVYSAIKKSIKIHPLQSLLYETIVLAPIALAVIVYLEVRGAGALQVGGVKYFLLMFAGLCTATPLALFSFAATKVSLITVGIVEYISPSISLAIGIFLLGEPFEIIQFAAFATIWVGLIFFTYGEFKDLKETVSS